MAPFFQGCASQPKVKPETFLQQLPQTTLSPEDYALQRMLDDKLSPEFLQEVKNGLAEKSLRTQQSAQDIIFLNVLGFLAHADYSRHYSAKAVREVRKFMKHYSKSLALAEKTFLVPKEVIASLIWVETKFGKHTGSYSLPWVYATLLQASHRTIAQKTIQELSNRKEAVAKLKPAMNEAEVNQKVIDRSIKKSNWALQQLEAMDRLYQNGFIGIIHLKSSFAGAFGYSQFIPSTYEKYAQSPRRKNANLFDMKDAIFSVGNFLHENGWKTGDATLQSNALFEYNRIRDYGDVVLKISGEAKIGPARKISKEE